MQSKTEFIRSQPAGMTPAEIVHAAAKAGIPVSSSYVYRLRAGARKTPKLTRGAKGKFVAGFPAGTSVSAIREAAKKAGITICDGYIHAVRSGRVRRSLGKAGANVPVQPAPVIVQYNPPAARGVNAGKVDDAIALMALIARVGVERARDCLAVIEEAAETMRGEV